MTTLDMTLATQSIDMTDSGLTEVGTVVERFSSEWSWVTPDGHDIDLSGLGLTYDASGRATGGTVNLIALDLGNNPGQPDIFIRDFTADATKLDNGGETFWNELLAGNDTILGPLIEIAGIAAQFKLFGDALRAPARAAEGGDDLFRAGDARAQVTGDVFDVNTGAAFTGGNDRIFVAPTELSQILFGDAGTVQGTGVLIGGGDVMAIRSVNALSIAVGDAGTVQGFGGVAKVAGGGDRISAEDGSAAQLVGDAGTVTQNSLITGGSDTIYGSERSEAIAGDVFRAISSDNVRIDGGNDVLNGNGGNDIISGDVHVSVDDVTISGGNDTIHGGEGDDEIYGEIAFGRTAATGGNDQLFGDAGNDLISGQSGNDILDGGAGADILSGGDGRDAASYASATAGVIAEPWRISSAPTSPTVCAVTILPMRCSAG